VLSLVIIALGQSYPGCNGKPDNKSTLYQNPVLQKTVSHGKRYYIQDPKDSSTYLHIAVLSGTAYQMGYAFGQLFKSELQDSIQLITQYINATAQAYYQFLPSWIQHQGNSYAESIWIGIRYEVITTKRYVPQRFIDEMQGIADATGIPYDTILAINLFPEVIEAQCSVAGIWGTASRSGHVFQMRALDWDYRAPMSKYPLVTIYHPSEANSQTFANIGWVGFIGSLTGFSKKVGISQKVWLPTRNNITTVFGKPWTFVLRDVLQFATGINSSLVMLEDAKRTYQIYVGVGSNDDKTFRGFTYAAKELNMYSDLNWSHPFSPAHPQMNGIMYWDETAKQDSPCFGQIFAQNYGIIDAQLLYQVAAPSQPTGDTQLAIYDFAQQVVYVSYPSYGSNPTPAYSRNMIFLNMTSLFNIAVTGDAPEEIQQVYV